MDPKADKYRPAWIRGAWLGKDASDMDLLYDGHGVIRTKAVRRIGEEWDATLVLGLDTIPSQVFGHRQNQAQANRRSSTCSTTTTH